MTHIYLHFDARITQELLAHAASPNPMCLGLSEVEIHGCWHGNACDSAPCVHGGRCVERAYGGYRCVYK